MGGTYEEIETDWGGCVYVATTLRTIEALGISLDSEFGCDDEEHTELLDDQNILRICGEVNAEIDSNGHWNSDPSYTVECLSGTVCGQANWCDCTTALTPNFNPYSCGGERELRIAQQNRMRKTCENSEILRNYLVAHHPGMIERLNAVSDACDEWNRDQFAGESEDDDNE